jgi:hypothetical protein
MTVATKPGRAVAGIVAPGPFSNECTNKRFGDAGVRRDDHADTWHHWRTGEVPELWDFRDWVSRSSPDVETSDADRRCEAGRPTRAHNPASASGLVGAAASRGVDVGHGGGQTDSRRDNQLS